VLRIRSPGLAEGGLCAGGVGPGWATCRLSSAKWIAKERPVEGMRDAVERENSRIGRPAKSRVSVA